MKGTLYNDDNSDVFQYFDKYIDDVERMRGSILSNEEI